MHNCDQTAQALKDAETTGTAADTLSGDAGTFGKKAAAVFEGAADTLKLESNQIGDMNAHDLGQSMKVHAGTVLHAAEESAAASVALKAAIVTAKALEGKDFSVPDNVYDAEAAIREVIQLSDKATDAGEASVALNDKLVPKVTAEGAAAAKEIFVPILEAVHRWQDTKEDVATAKTDATTCTGELAAEPLMGVTVAECAEVCNTEAPSSADNYCVAFQHFYMGGMTAELVTDSSSDKEETGLCVLFKSLDHVYKYDCTAPSLLQTAGAPEALTTANQCQARFSWIHAAPRKPEYEQLDTCLDVGRLVMPALDLPDKF